MIFCKNVKTYFLIKIEELNKNVENEKSLVFEIKYKNRYIA